MSPLQSPLVWDFAHIGHFEELWLVRNVGGNPPLHAEHDDVYDAFAHARAERGELPFLQPAAARSFVDDVRGRALRGPGRAWSRNRRPAAGRSGFVFGLVVPTRAAAHRDDGADHCSSAVCRSTGPCDCPRHQAQRRGSDRRWARSRSARLPTSPGRTTTSCRRTRPTSSRSAIDRALVTNEEYVAFVAAGGYRRPRRSGATRAGRGGRWRTPSLPSTGGPTARAAGCGGASTLLEPVPPTAAGAARLLLGGRCVRALVGQAPAERAGVGEGGAQRRARARDRRGLAVDIVTASPAYPGFRAFPYPEYSEVFYGDEYRVLRGGSWVTDPLVARLELPQLGLPAAAPDLLGNQVCA